MVPCPPTVALPTLKTSNATGRFLNSSPTLLSLGYSSCLDWPVRKEGWVHLEIHVHAFISSLLGNVLCTNWDVSVQGQWQLKCCEKLIKFS